MDCCDCAGEEIVKLLSTNVSHIVNRAEKWAAKATKHVESFRQELAAGE